MTNRTTSTHTHQDTYLDIVNRQIALALPSTNPELEEQRQALNADVNRSTNNSNLSLVGHLQSVQALQSQSPHNFFNQSSTERVSHTREQLQIAQHSLSVAREYSQVDVNQFCHSSPAPTIFTNNTSDHEFYWSNLQTPPPPTVQNMNLGFFPNGGEGSGGYYHVGGGIYCNRSGHCYSTASSYSNCSSGNSGDGTCKSSLF